MVKIKHNKDCGLTFKDGTYVSIERIKWLEETLDYTYDEVKEMMREFIQERTDEKKRITLEKIEEFKKQVESR